MITKVKEEKHVLTRDQMTVETDIAVSTGEGLQNIWDYLVPIGMSLVFRHTDHFAAYLLNTSTAEPAVGSLLDIIVTDSSRQSIKQILNQIRYSQARGSATTLLAFQDVDYFNYLDIPEGEVVIVEEGERVIIRGNINATLHADNSYFNLTCHRVRHTLFE